MRDSGKKPGKAEAAATDRQPIPAVMPRICGNERRKPNVAPDEVSMTLFGPGVKAAVAEKITSPRMEALSMSDQFIMLIDRQHDCCPAREC